MSYAGVLRSNIIKPWKLFKRMHLRNAFSKQTVHDQRFQQVKKLNTDNDKEYLQFLNASLLAAVKTNQFGQYKRYMQQLRQQICQEKPQALHMYLNYLSKIPKFGYLSTFFNQEEYLKTKIEQGEYQISFNDFALSIAKH